MYEKNLNSEPSFDSQKNEHWERRNSSIRNILRDNVIALAGSLSHWMSAVTLKFGEYRGIAIRIIRCTLPLYDRVNNMEFRYKSCGCDSNKGLKAKLEKLEPNSTSTVPSIVAIVWIRYSSCICRENCDCQSRHLCWVGVTRFYLIIASAMGQSRSVPSNIGLSKPVC